VKVRRKCFTQTFECTAPLWVGNDLTCGAWLVHLGNLFGDARCAEARIPRLPRRSLRLSVGLLALRKSCLYFSSYCLFWSASAFSFAIADLHPQYNANVLPNFQEFCKISVLSRHRPVWQRLGIWTWLVGVDRAGSAKATIPAASRKSPFKEGKARLCADPDNDRETGDGDASQFPSIFSSVPKDLLHILLPPPVWPRLKRQPKPVCICSLVIVGLLILQWTAHQRSLVGPVDSVSNCYYAIAVTDFQGWRRNFWKLERRNGVVRT